MSMEELDQTAAQDSEQEQHSGQDTLPIGIARIRDEWRAAGLVESEQAVAGQDQVEPVIFPEIDGGAGVGDYTVDCQVARDHLALSEDAMDRLVNSGEIDSILVQGADGTPRRLISESSLGRFLEDSAIDPEAVTRAAKALVDKNLAFSFDELRASIEDLKANQGKILQQMKDILLLEVRNLKEQDRDLTSFVYELAEEIRDALPKKKRK